MDIRFLCGDERLEVVRFSLNFTPLKMFFGTRAGDEKGQVV